MKLISWDPERWSSLAVNTLIRRLEVHYYRDDNTFFFSWWRRKKLNRKFPKLTNFEVCCHLHVYPAQTMCPGALKFHFESALKQIFFTNTILHFKSNHFKVNSSFPMPVVTAIASRKLRLFLKLHLFNSTLQTFLFILCICK